MVAVSSSLEWTLGTVAVVALVLCLLFWLTRDRKNRRLRVGFFLERERFIDDRRDDDEPSVDDVRRGV